MYLKSNQVTLQIHTLEKLVARNKRHENEADYEAFLPPCFSRRDGKHAQLVNPSKSGNRDQNEKG